MTDNRVNHEAWSFGLGSNARNHKNLSDNPKSTIENPKSLSSMFAFFLEQASEIA